MRALILAALLTLGSCASAPALAGVCIGPAAPHLARLAASGLPSETAEGEVMARVVTELRTHVAFDERPSRIVVVFGESRAAIWLIQGDALCNVIYGPADAVRAMLREARGAPA
jgi:hypothetical protein